MVKNSFVIFYLDHKKNTLKMDFYMQILDYWDNLDLDFDLNLDPIKLKINKGINKK